MKNYIQTKQLHPVKWSLILLLVIGQSVLIISCSLKDSSSLDFHLEDHVFGLDLSHKNVKIRDDRGTLSRSIKIKKIEGAYIAHIDSTQPGKQRWYIELEGYQPIDLMVDLPPGKRTLQKVLLTPTFGGVYAWGVDGLEPAKPMRINIKVKMAEFESTVLACEGVNVSNLTPGDYTIAAEAKGYNPVSYPIKVEPAKPLEVKLVFMPIPGNLRVFAADAKNPGKLLEKELLVKVGGKQASGKAHQGVFIKDLPPIEYTIAAEMQGYSTGTLNTKIIPGKTTEETILLDISTGSLKIFAADARHPREAFDKDITVKIGDKEAFGKGSEGVVISGLLPGRYTFEITAPGFKPGTQSANTSAGKTKEVTVLLNPLLGGVKVIAVDAKNPSTPLEKKFKVKVGDKEGIGKANEGVMISNLSPGNYTVNAEMEGFYPQSETVEIESGETREVIIYLNPILAKINIRTTPPGASIYLDCQKREEKTPAAIIVPFGEHKIVVSRKGNKPEMRKINLSLTQPIAAIDLTLGSEPPVSGDENLRIESINGMHYPGIKLVIRVKDPSGTFASGLEKEDISLEESCEELCLDAKPSFDIKDVSKMDIVFFIDTTSSMEEEMNSVIRNIQAFCDTLLAQNINFRLAGYSFGDEVPYRAKFPFTAVFKDSLEARNGALSFKSWLSTLSAIGGDDPLENSLDPLIDAGRGGLDFRPDAARVGILVSDVPAHIAGDGGDSDTTATYEKAKQAIHSLGFKLYFSSPFPEYGNKLPAINLGWPFNDSVLMDKFLNELLGWYELTFSDAISAGKEHPRRLKLKVRVKSRYGSSQDLTKTIVFYPMDW
jgi:hypothetical protein